MFSLGNYKILLLVNDTDDPGEVAGGGHGRHRGRCR